MPGGFLDISTFLSHQPTSNKKRAIFAQNQPMKVLIVEDEPPAAKRLRQLLLEKRPAALVVGMQDGVENTVRWLRSNPTPDLLFFDIQLADGLSFDIFQQQPISAPVIFTTAYDQYTLQAFKLNSVDYLLKPIDPEELEQALQKFDRWFGPRPALTPETLQNLLQTFAQPSYKERFMIKIGQQLTYILAQDVAYFYSEDGLAFAQMNDKKRHAIDYTLDQLEDRLDPRYFFRLNRKVIAHIQSIRKAEPYFNSRFILELQPPASFELIISRDRASAFKAWLDK
jgi:DNA-binding LytR/AlgR family response regulator